MRIKHGWMCERASTRVAMGWHQVQKNGENKCFLTGVEDVVQGLGAPPSSCDELPRRVFQDGNTM